MEWFEQACTVICTIISSLQTIITASLSTPCQSKPVSVPVKCHMNRVEMMILHQNRVILGIVFHPVYLFVPNFPNLTNINVILIMMITINCFWWLKKKLVSHRMNTHEGYTFCRCLCAYFASLLFFQNKPKYRYSMYACDGTKQIGFLDFVWIQQVTAFYQSVPTCQKRIPFMYIHSRINNHFFIQWYMETMIWYFLYKQKYIFLTYLGRIWHKHFL